MHNYVNVDTQDAVYEMFRVLKEEKRDNHLDTLDTFDVWKENYYNQMDEKSARHLAIIKVMQDRVWTLSINLQLFDDKYSSVSQCFSSLIESRCVLVPLPGRSS